MADYSLDDVMAAVQTLTADVAALAASLSATPATQPALPAGALTTAQVQQFLTANPTITYDGVVLMPVDPNNPAAGSKYVFKFQTPNAAGMGTSVFYRDA